MKNVQKKTAKQTYTIVHSPKQRLFGVLGFVALFVCGIMVGWGINSGRAPEHIKSAQAAEQKATCAVIEEIQLRWLHDESSSMKEEHQANVRVYETLLQYGCDANQDKYRAAIAREMRIIESLGNASTCGQIEASLLDRLPSGHAGVGSEQRIERAKIFANLSERGCAENSQKYVEMAKQELEIARALEDDEFDQGETIEVVETYKRLNMQAAAEEIFETAKKLTNPAIDFILEVEKIINEK